MEQSSMEKYVPLHVCHVNKTSIIINRAHAFLHFIAILFLIHYRLSFFFQHPKNTTIPTLPWLLIFVSELLLSLAWLFTQSYRWRPVTRTVFPERLPADDKLPAIDVFICTADPNKEPSVEVMNTVISAMALAYPPEKLHVYVSDDAGSDVTLRCMKEAWNFARYWVPFCRKYDLVTACPDVYFSSSEVDSGDFEGSEFKAARTKIEEKYEVLKQRIRRIVQQHSTTGDALHNTRDHPSIIEIFWHGFDGVGGPTISGSNFYIKREALLGSFSKQQELMALKRSFGPSNDFIKTLVEDYKPGFIHDGESSRMLLEKANVLASCSYENQTSWGSKVGFLYFCVVEDYFTGFTLHRKGWKSVYLYPKKPQFLGIATTNFNDTSIQWTRWASGLTSVAISKFCPLIYGPLKMSWVQLMCYSKLAFMPLLNCLSLWGFALIPQLCLFNDISLYPKVSDSNFNIFFIIFVSAILKSLYEVVTTGGQVRTWRNDWRIWMMRSVTSYFYGSLDVVFNKLGMKEASFLPTNKVIDDEHAKLYEMGIFDFRTATTFLAPLVTVILVNIAAFVRALVVNVVDNDRDGFWEKMFGQMFLSFYILVSNYTVIEGMIIRRDKASIPLYVTLLSGVFSVFILLIGSAILC
ncbi:hypothetical protein ERO13_A09G224000v2 [Gossypium hirsutum]|uniref:Cellulose synthase-like protein G2 isoform X2 n=1 Tax=Gossypium hirsutum TaxID=3635 RepID=A0A1U8LPS6_GOSHI|nr:cellulose synthase-like protein G2 isoform X2 [Gossypium hirsutum]KAG4185357.1 hypothetical protein ERO13_A09G224000v2 [Gossypium hirsutum]